MASTRERPSSRPSSRRWKRCADGIVARDARLDEDVAAVDRHQEAAEGVVGEGIEGAAAREVEPGVVPVAGDQPGFDRPLVQREAHVRAPVLDRPGAVLTPEDDDRQVADLGQQPTGDGLEFRERPGNAGTSSRVCRCLHPGGMVRPASSDTEHEASRPGGPSANACRPPCRSPTNISSRCWRRWRAMPHARHATTGPERWRHWSATRHAASWWSRRRGGGSSAVYWVATSAIRCAGRRP